MRYITSNIIKDLKKKMVFVGGPRQVGKTTLAQHILSKKFKKGAYFNWDLDEDRHDLLAKKWHSDQKLIVFDELHKYPRWKTWIKGLYDVSHTRHQFLVTGSARLDVFRRGGDSLLGRYHYWRLYPFSLGEIPKGITPNDAFNRLMTVGGFPEPFLDNDEREARRWRRERFDRILREDIRDLEPIRNIQLMNLFVDQLRRRVGSNITKSNLANDIQVSPKTITSWLELLERMYLVFSVRPYTRSLPRAIQKPPKVYFFDNADIIGNIGARFENLVATTLLKQLHFMEDYEGYHYELRYIRDKEKRAVDFAVIKEGVLEEIIEVKYSDDKVQRALVYFAEKLKPKKVTQIVAQIKRPYQKGRINVIDPISYFSRKPWS